MPADKQSLLRNFGTILLRVCAAIFVRYCLNSHGNSIYFFIVMKKGGAERRNRHFTVTSKRHKPCVSVRGVEGGKGKREREGKTARGEAGASKRPL